MDLKRKNAIGRTPRSRPSAPGGESPRADDAASPATSTGGDTRAIKRTSKQPVMADTSTMRRQPRSAPTPAPPPAQAEYLPVDGQDGGLEARVWIEGSWLPVGVIVIGPNGVRIRLGGPPPNHDELIVAVRTSPTSGLIVQMRESVVETRRDARGTILNLRHRELHCPAPRSQLHGFLVDVLGIARPEEESFRAEGRGVYYDFDATPAQRTGLATTDDFMVGSEPHTAVRANPLAEFQRKGQ